MLDIVEKGFVQTGPSRWTDAAYARQTGRRAYTPAAAPAKAAPSAAIAASKPPANAGSVAMMRRLRRRELIDLLEPAARRAAAAKAKAAAPAKPAMLPPPPAQTRHPAFDGPHGHRAGIAEFAKYLNAAAAIRSVRPLNAEELHRVEFAEARLRELRQFAGQWGG